MCQICVLRKGGEGGGEKRDIDCVRKKGETIIKHKTNKSDGEKERQS